MASIIAVFCQLFIVLSVGITAIQACTPKSLICMCNKNDTVNGKFPIVNVTRTLEVSEKLPVNITTVHLKFNQTVTDELRTPPQMNEQLAPIIPKMALDENNKNNVIESEESI